MIYLYVYANLFLFFLLSKKDQRMSCYAAICGGLEYIGVIFLYNYPHFRMMGKFIIRKNYYL